MTTSTVSRAFQVTEEDVERSSTLEPSDIGRWALLINGAYHFFESEEDAEACRREVFNAID
ncbi:MAG TPA: hypothetical protein V6C65_40825 [Allocoleopsis sp.]